MHNTKSAVQIARTTNTNGKCRQITMTYFGARNLHIRKLLNSPYFASKFLQRFVHNNKLLYRRYGIWDEDYREQASSICSRHDGELSKYWSISSLLQLESFHCPSVGGLSVRTTDVNEIKLIILDSAKVCTCLPVSELVLDSVRSYNVFYSSYLLWLFHCCRRVTGVAYVSTAECKIRSFPRIPFHSQLELYLTKWPGKVKTWKRNCRILILLDFCMSPFLYDIYCRRLTNLFYGLSRHRVFLTYEFDRS